MKKESKALCLSRGCPRERKKDMPPRTPGIPAHRDEAGAWQAQRWLFVVDFGPGPRRFPDWAISRQVFIWAACIASICSEHLQILKNAIQFMNVRVANVGVTMHLLLARANRFPLGKIEDISGWLYQRTLGAWVDADEPNNLMVSSKPAAAPSPRPEQPSTPPQKPKPIPASKKCDVETGEDMKGT